MKQNTLLTLVFLCLISGSLVHAQNQALPASKFTFADSAQLKTGFDLGDCKVPCWPGNGSEINPVNAIVKDSKLFLKLTKDDGYKGASAITKEEYSYGRFEAVMKPGCVSGGVTGFFLFRWDPWQEIDFEFMGDKGNKIQTSVVYNGGKLGDGNDVPKYNSRVTDLNFNACDKEHKYTVEWHKDKLSFYADDQLIEERTTEVPYLPMTVHLNLWLNVSGWEDPGPVKDELYPAAATVKSLTVTTDPVSN